MYDSTLHKKTLERHFIGSDFDVKKWGLTPEDKPQIITDALRIAAAGFTRLALRRSLIGGKPVFRHGSLSESLLIRHVSESIRVITGVRQSDRSSIIKSLRALVAEGVPFKVLKFDIKSFYESIDRPTVLQMLEGDAAFSRQNIFVLKSFFSALERMGIAGLPRGLGLSATLSEYLLRDFDSEIRSLPGVRFYSRFVDDGIIILSEKVSTADLTANLEGLLPAGLHFNQNKTKTFELKAYAKSNTGSVEATLTFLGYELTVHQVQRVDNFRRIVRLDISISKTKKIKRRLAKAMLRFNQDSNFDDLLGRVKLLTCNHGVLDSASGQTRYSGLRYNYGMIDFANSEAITDLDKFLLNSITSRHRNNRIRPNLSKVQERRLLGFSFRSGFEENIFFSFQRDHLMKLIRCWINA